jgi:hypothetical protein
MAIHASARLPSDIRQIMLETPFMRDTINEYLFPFGGDIIHRLSYLPTGVILATGNLVDVVKITRENAPKTKVYHFGDYTPGRFMWIFKDLKLLDEPIPAKGSLGIWEFDFEKGERVG